MGRVEGGDLDLGGTCGGGGMDNGGFWRIFISVLEEVNIIFEIFRISSDPQRWLSLFPLRR